MEVLRGPEAGLNGKLRNRLNTIRRMVEQTGPESQREVQRLLGRCLLRLQQYERLLKALIARSEISGAVHEIESRLAERAAEVEKLTLGSLMKSLFGEVVVIEGRATDEPAREPPDPKTVTITTRHNIEMSEVGFVQMKAALKDLVDLRNDLVHHLIERFDLWSDEGCVAAGHHLQASYSRIDGHFAELRQWATSMDDARAMHASFMQTEVFQDFLVNGIAPDGTIDWPAAGIVSVLREAGGERKHGDWTCLDDAVAWIGGRHSEQTPAKYGCKSWPDVLHKSRAFDLEYRPDAAGRKVGWYRERV